MNKIAWVIEVISFLLSVFFTFELLVIPSDTAVKVLQGFLFLMFLQISRAARRYRKRGTLPERTTTGAILEEVRYALLLLGSGLVGLMFSELFTGEWNLFLDATLEAVITFSAMKFVESLMAYTTLQQQIVVVSASGTASKAIPVPIQQDRLNTAPATTKKSMDFGAMNAKFREFVQRIRELTEKHPNQVLFGVSLLLLLAMLFAGSYWGAGFATLTTAIFYKKMKDPGFNVMDWVKEGKNRYKVTTLTGLYLAIGWMLGGHYLLSLLGFAACIYGLIRWLGKEKEAGELAAKSAKVSAEALQKSVSFLGQASWKGIKIAGKHFAEVSWKRKLGYVGALAFLVSSVKFGVDGALGILLHVIEVIFAGIAPILGILLVLWLLFTKRTPFEKETKKKAGE